MKHALAVFFVIIGIIVVLLLVRSALTTQYTKSIIGTPSLIPAGLDAQGKATSTPRK